MLWLIKYLNQRFLKDFRPVLDTILGIAIPLLVMLVPLWWWSRSFLFIPNLFRSLTGRSIALIIFGMIIGGFLPFYAKGQNFFSKKPLWKRNPPSFFPKTDNNSKLLVITFSLVFYLSFLFLFLGDVSFEPRLPWREAYVIAVILLFPFYFGPLAGMFIDTFIWFWLYVLKFVIYGLRGELEGR